MKTLYALLGLFCVSHAYGIDDQPQKVSEEVDITFLAETTAKGQKIKALALKYEDNILSGSDLSQLYKVTPYLDGKPLKDRVILKAYVNDQPDISFKSKQGKFVVIEMDVRDKGSDLYEIKVENDNPMLFREKDIQGNIISSEKKQAIRVPVFYGERLSYNIEQTGFLKLTNGKTLDKDQWIETILRDNLKTDTDSFVERSVAINDPKNKLHYRLHIPSSLNKEKYPLIIFLHGSGQVGKDNIAHLLSSKGAIATLQYEDGFVLAPQYDSVFDSFDNYSMGSKGGIHWQTDNRHNLLLKMIDNTLDSYPMIDPNRIYITGLSRGAEGGLYLLLKRPDFFAGALLMGGREAYTIEWIDGNATKENLSPIKNIPIWFFHSKEDKVSPVKGSRINYQILTKELNAPYVKYTEFSTEKEGDNGIINNNPHNTWDAVFNSPEVLNWLLQQRRAN
ncbi:alpha/beta hydrolase-fold protein [Glaesserella parasuis]|uniref:alpha/beta hydrolase-fold protein n=1 Tax=Glaesserella parasuis TaxID=738 RepID=UPI002436E734|nr:alpha/beta hydrolase-fold protein [Glaesserella parasuis]MDG6366341.1 alpha/beta hydrolase-fold protein [Glaesserella parasuis]MDG6372724.1 alpha/beta hydrolase-fold protein [Glaesserella parasuis]MDG6444648.1 alpha/beta hydrolase-fold protein [Glaesserella parasuis]MDO9733389.1 alpha/beta hydrolase-fold protein [Glaesserella parasuis]MDP0113940.1 alpha/beta hydrolase-fold protein [Glaesserella parasuis]